MIGERGDQQNWRLSAERGTIHVEVVFPACCGGERVLWGWTTTSPHARALADGLLEVAHRADGQMPKMPSPPRRFPWLRAMAALWIVALVAHVVVERDGMLALAALAWYGVCSLLLDALSALARRCRR